MNKKILVGKKEIIYKASPLTAVAFERLTGQCLFNELSKMQNSGEVKGTFYLYLLFSLAWGANKELIFEDFAESLASEKGGFAIFNDINFIKSMLKILTEEFDVKIDEEQLDNHFKKVEKRAAGK